MCVCVCCPQGLLLGLRPNRTTKHPSFLPPINPTTTTTNPSTSLPTNTIQDSPVGVSHSPRFKSGLVTSPHPGSHPDVPLTFLQPLSNVQATSGPRHLLSSASHTPSHQWSAQMCRRPRAESPSPQSAVPCWR